MAKKSKSLENAVFQFKLTLVGIDPPIWRRIQVPDGPLAELHNHIQKAMGWEDYHLHHFAIGDVRYGDPGLLEEAFDPYEDEDSLLVYLSDLFEKRRKGFRFTYVYDFGDSWWHEGVFEGAAPTDPKGKYPTCTEGERACPPEDCGGPPGYQNLLKVLADTKSPQHRVLSAWAGNFDAEKFSAAGATKRMRRGSSKER